MFTGRFFMLKPFVSAPSSKQILVAKPLFHPDLP